jgi:hypothetical protein
MTGRHRLPGGEQRRASQKRARPAAPKAIRVEIPWAPGDRVRWRDRVGFYRRDVDDEHAEAVFDQRVYRVRKVELRPG